MIKHIPPTQEYQLNIDPIYQNTLDIEGFSRMMKDSSFCYKFYWLEAIVQLISEGKKEATYDEIINEMIANAWYSVLEFHVHLSGIWGDGEIENKIQEFDQQLHSEKMTLTQNVPYKALSGFANKGSQQIDLNSSAGRMMAYYNQMIQYEKVRWLQNNNPEVPGLVYKLAPLDDRMRKLGHVRKLWEGILDIATIQDVFGEEPIKKKSYDVVHKKPGIRKLYEACYRDNLHSIWASQELYRKGNSREEFYRILEKNMRPVYDSARRQGYEIWNR